MSTIQSNVQAVNPNVQYVVQAPMKEGKNFIEGLMWGVNGVQNVSLGIGATVGTVALDVFVLGAIRLMGPGEVMVTAIALVAYNALAYKVITAEFSIAGKSFTHMSNTIW